MVKYIEWQKFILIVFLFFFLAFMIFRLYGAQFIYSKKGRRSRKKVQQPFICKAVSWFLYFGTYRIPRKILILYYANFLYVGSVIFVIVVLHEITHLQMISTIWFIFFSIPYVVAVIIYNVVVIIFHIHKKFYRKNGR